MSKQDSHFFNNFSLVLGILFAVTIGLFAFARHVGAEQSGQAGHHRSAFRRERRRAPAAGAHAWRSPARTIRRSRSKAWDRRSPAAALAGGRHCRLRNRLLGLSRRRHRRRSQGRRQGRLGSAHRAGQGDALQPRPARLQRQDRRDASPRAAAPTGRTTSIKQAVDHIVETNK